MLKNESEAHEVDGISSRPPNKINKVGDAGKPSPQYQPTVFPFSSHSPPPLFFLKKIFPPSILKLDIFILEKKKI